MNYIKFVLLLVISSMLLSSCKKCVSCSYAAIGLDPYSSDYCSKRSKDIDAFKKGVSDEAQRYGTSATCIDKDN